MKIVLINPPLFFYNQGEINYPQCLGLLHIASKLKQRGHQVKLIEAIFEGRNNRIKNRDNLILVGLSNKEIIEKIDPLAELIGISVHSPHSAELSHQLISDIKNKYPLIPIIMGGIYPSLQPEIAITSQADYICVGEGEIAMTELADYIKNKTPKLPAGIYDSPASTYKTTIVEDLDALTAPDWSLIELDKILNLTPLVTPMLRTILINGSRGCPFNCNYCSLHAVNSHKIRLRSPRIVASEITDLIQNYNINHIEFVDSCFISNKAHSLKLASVLQKIANHHSFCWSASPRIDSLDEELIQAFSKANCYEIVLPVEHGSQNVLKAMNKEYDQTHLLKIASLLKKYNIRTKFVFICGHYSEKNKDFKMSIQLGKRLKKINSKSIFQIFIAQPYPQTKLYNECQQQQYIPAELFSSIKENRFSHSSNTVFIETDHFSKKDIIKRAKILQKKLDYKSYLKFNVLNKMPVPLIHFVVKLYHSFRNS